MNKKCIIFTIICIIIAITLTIIFAYLINKITYIEFNKEYLKAVKIGSKILKEEFPDIIDSKTKFVAYFHDNMWHVQNILLDDDGEKLSTGPVVYNNIEKIKYVKVDIISEKSIFIGDYYTEEIPEDLLLSGDEYFMSKVGKRLTKRLYNIYSDIESHAFKQSAPSYGTWTIICEKETPEGELTPIREYFIGVNITIRASDGMIIFIHNYGF